MPTVCFLPKSQQGIVGGPFMVISLLTKHLPRFGWEVVDNPNEADVVHGHAIFNSERLDVFTCHGVYPVSEDTPAWQRHGNRVISRNFKIAEEVTTVSKWTASRFDWWEGIEPTIIHNFIDLDAWDNIEGHFQTQKPYALWAKIKPYRGIGETIRLAQKNPNYNFVVTVAPIPVTSNVKVTGILPFDQMKLALKDCSIYLSLSAEDNFPIQILEAMALSKPILAFATGGIPEAIRHKREGYIIQNPTEDEIQRGFDFCLVHGEELGRNARKRVEELFSVEKVVPQYVEVYERILASRKKKKKGPKCSIVITTHNFEDYIKECIDSALAQDYDSFEVIVVDDCSTDGTWDIIKSYGRRIRRKRFGKPGGKIHGIVRSRNVGVEMAKGEFVSCLDGDDKILPSFLSELVPLLESDKALGIVYSDFELFGTSKGIIKAPKFDFERLKRGNYIPCCNLFRKKAWERVGGCRPVGESWEDYNTWLTIAERGWGAKHHRGALFLYRKKGTEGRDAESQPFVQRLRAVVNAYHPMILPPQVSVVIPCYDHEKYLKEAIDSVFAQSYQDFEIMVVNDGSPGDPGKIVDEYWDPRIRLVEQENKGLAGARNFGITKSRGRFILPLDADDKLHPDFLEKAMKIQGTRGGKAAVYSDFIAFWDNGSESKEALTNYDFKTLLQKAMMPCTILYPKKAWKQVEGYKSVLEHGYEDWEFSILLGEKGYYGVRIPEHLFYYRQHGGTSMRDKMQNGSKNKEAKQIIRELHRETYMSYESQQKTISLPVKKVEPQPEELVKLRYTGKKEAMVTYKVPGRRAFQVSTQQPFIFVPSERVGEMLRLHFERV
ncbi:MAG: glycosyltransferase [Chloroflexi bacterium]|nr:glycosyltransferase [Chloroflexota bacterium]